MVVLGIGARRRCRDIGLVVPAARHPDLVEVGTAGRIPLRVNRALVDTDLLVVVTSAESGLHGGPAALLGASGAEALRTASRHPCDACR
jgi:hypothetical protein